MLPVETFNPEVLFAVDEVRKLGEADLAELAERARQNPAGKCRICLHRSPQDDLHEMLIALSREVAYPPHRALKTEETHFVLLGLATLRLYHEGGRLRQVIPMGPWDSGRTSYVRLPRATYHDLVIESEMCIYLETKLGPFRPADNEFAPFPGGGL